MKTKNIYRVVDYKHNKRGVKLKKELQSRIKIKTIVYDSNLDILELYTGATTQHCININDLFIIHYNEKNKIVGIEILGISKIYGINKKALNSIKSAKIIMNTIPEENKVFIRAELVYPIKNEEIITNLIASPPYEAPLVCN